MNLKLVHFKRRNNSFFGLLLTLHSFLIPGFPKHFLTCLTLFNCVCVCVCAGHSELQNIVDTLAREVEGQSNLLVRLLQLRDKREAKLEKQYQRMTAILKDYATKNGQYPPLPTLYTHKSQIACTIGD